MRVQYNFEKKKDYRDFVDISKYTGMEVEHGHNTGAQHYMNSNSTLGHFNPNNSEKTAFKTT